MRSKSFLATIAFFAAMLSMPIASAGDDAVSTMAGIMISLQHFPSDADKQKLGAIAGKACPARCLEMETGIETALGRYENARRERTAWCQRQSRERGKLFQRIATREELDGDRAERGRRLYGYDAASVPLQPAG